MIIVFYKLNGFIYIKLIAFVKAIMTYQPLVRSKLRRYVDEFWTFWLIAGCGTHKHFAVPENSFNFSPCRRMFSNIPSLFFNIPNTISHIARSSMRKLYNNNIQCTYNFSDLLTKTNIFSDISFPTFESVS